MMQPTIKKLHMIRGVGAIAASDSERGLLAAAWMCAPGDMAALSVLSCDPMHVPYDRNYHEHDCHYRMDNVVSNKGSEFTIYSYRLCGGVGILGSVEMGKRPRMPTVSGGRCSTTGEGNMLIYNGRFLCNSTTITRTC